MARDVILVNDSTSDWLIPVLGGLVVPASGILDISLTIPDPELTTAIQNGLYSEFDSQHYLRINGVNKSATQSADFGDIADSGQPLNGFVNRTDSQLSMISSTFNIQPTTTSYEFWSNNVRFVKTSASQVVINNDQTLHYVYFDIDGILQVSTSAWDLTSDNVPVALVYRDGSNYVIEDERHGYRRNRDWHKWAHSTIGARYGSGLSGTFDNTSLSVTQGIVFDEDIEFNTTNTKTNCQLWYRNSTLNAMRVELGVTVPYKLVAGVLQYDNLGVLTSVQNNYYVNSYVYATLSSDYPIIILIGQQQHSNIASAQNESFPSILLSTAEWKLIYKVTYRNVGGTPTYFAAQDERLVSSGPAGTASSNDHTALINRDASDQHPASSISNTPAGGISATNVQTAINELDTEKQIISHSHTGTTDSPKLSQADTHESADTDSAPTALHHTLGTGANQACAGNDSRLIFGQDLTVVASEAESSISGTTAWQQKLTTGNLTLQTGSYIVQWYAELSFSSISDDINFRIQQNNTTDLANNNIEPKDNTNYFPVSGFYVINTTSGTYYFDMDYSTESTNTGYIRRARLIVWRLT